MQINTDILRVIYPEGQEEEAKRISNLINYLHKNHLTTVGTRTKKIDLVLQTNRVVSNGYVSLSPYISEFYTTPFQNNQIIGTSNWLDELAIHEYRHALQFSNANRGATKVFHVLQGQGGWAGAMFLAIPNWYLEGDAVVSETVLTNSGRGRAPVFFKEQRALLLNDLDYSYIKARNGSYKDIVPSRYPLGYAITNYGRNNFGQDVWKNILADAGAYKTILYPFSGAMNIHTGMRAPAMYKAAYSELREQWVEELERIPITTHTSITEKQKTVTNHQYAKYTNDGSVLYLGSSFKKTPAVYHLKEDSHTLLTQIGTSVNTFLSENNNRLAWTEYQRDVRWGNLSYTKVVTFDITTGEKKTIAQKTKFFSPQVSGDGSRIAAARYTSELESDIVLLDIETGLVEHVLQNPNQHIISYPNWTSDDKSIVYVAKQRHQLAILKYDIEKNRITPLTNWTHHTIGSISVGKNRVVFVASYSGIDNIFSVDLDGSRKITQLTSATIGAYQPDISTDGETIIFSEFTEKGYVLSSLKISESLQKEIDPVEPAEMGRFNIKLADYEGNILDKIPDTGIESTTYRGFLKGTKLHDWGVSGGSSEVFGRLGFTNILNDFNANLIGGFNTNEETFSYGVSAQYGKFFPVIKLSAFNSDRSAVVLAENDSLFIDRFEQNAFSAGVSIPLAWQRGNYSTGVTIDTDLVGYQLDNGFSASNTSRNITSFELSIQAYNIRRRAYQNVQSRFGQYLFAYYSRSLASISGERFNIQSGIYLPGLALNHGILIEGEYQRESLSNVYQYSDLFNYARGYAYVLNDEVYRLSLNYQLPLLYPDWGFFNFAYFKRIRLNGFFDVAESNVFFANSTLTRKSFGGELIFDNVMLNVLPVSFVIRQSFLPDAFDGDPATNFDFFVRISF
ncbi:MAG: hypothetical protein JJ971_06810 [Balneolaceae bacterium]|nr:hypothetical protein [Balneolaceae bacterium]MBO6546085.1 hypothetical protein [Balneolaceae bacterium]MBO6647481.1 hypothetical protein [Balneolaceae bacterium]